MLQNRATKGLVVMAKIPYLIRRKNVFYFRLGVPAELRELVKSREIIQSLRTEDSQEAALKALKLAAHFKTLLRDLQNSKQCDISRFDSLAILSSDLAAQKNTIAPIQAAIARVTSQEAPQAPLLSVVVDDFLKRYDQNNKATFTKLSATLPLLVDLVGDKPVNQILQADLNGFFDDVQRLPIKRTKKIYSGMTIREIIAANDGRSIAEGTFESTYKACVSIFLTWAESNYKDQGFPSLSVAGAVYRGERADGINKQRAMKPVELQKLFNNPKMKKFAANPDTAHYCWLPLIGLFTGARINEICQLSPAEDIKQDSGTGIYYFHFTDEGEAVEGVDKSIKTNSSKRIVPIHSKLIDLGFLDYVERIKREGSKLLFPAWEPRDGKASANAGKWFVRYLESIGLRDKTEGARLSGFHSFRHTFITHAMQNKIPGVFSITGHETEVVDGFGKISAVAKGYWTRGIADDIQERKETIEKFDFGLSFYRPKRNQ